MIVYIIECANNKYFVTSNSEIYLGDNSVSSLINFFGKNNEFLKKLKPSKIIQIIHDDNANIDDYVLKCMKQKGINNVRGGSYSVAELDESNLKKINELLKNDILDKSFDNYADKFIDITEITEEIDKIQKYYKDVRRLKCEIGDLSKINISQFDNIKRITFDNKNNSKIASKDEELIQLIKRTHAQYCKNISFKYNDYDNLDFEALQIINLCIDKQRELAELLTEYITEENIKNILIQLYKKRIDILST